MGLHNRSASCDRHPPPASQAPDRPGRRRGSGGDRRVGRPRGGRSRRCPGGRCPAQNRRTAPPRPSRRRAPRDRGWARRGSDRRRARETSERSTCAAASGPAAPGQGVRRERCNEMRDSGDSYDDMERFALDQDTADRLLSGALAPEDAPHRYGEVASLLRMAAGPTAGALDGEAAAVAEVVEAIRSGLAPTPARQRLPWHRARLRTAAAALVGAVTVTGSLAAADALPAPAQRVAAHAFSVVGVDIPNPSHGPETR